MRKKKQIIPFGSIFDALRVTSGGEVICSSNEAKNLDFIMDYNSSFGSQIKSHSKMVSFFEKSL